MDVNFYDLTINTLFLVHCMLIKLIKCAWLQYSQIMIF